MADSLLNVFSLDLAYFESYAPVVRDIQNIVIAVGWALLLANLVFQATRSMAAGLGFEGEDPVALSTRSFVFAFLLMGSRQICAIGLNFTSSVMDLLQVPDAVNIITPEEEFFGIDASWLLAMIVGLILIFQVIKFFFEIGERYVVTAILVVLAPLAFGMGGSKNTEDIFKGWCRMFGSMCVMMLMNVIFLKLLLSTMSTMPTGAGVFPWLIFVTAIVRVGRKIDDIVCRMGLNPAQTGSPLGHGFMALPMMMANQATRTVMQTVAANRAGSGNNPSSGGRNAGRPSGSSSPPPSPGSAPSGGGSVGSSGTSSHASGASSPNTSSNGTAANPTTSQTAQGQSSTGQAVPPTPNAAQPNQANSANGQSAAIPTRPPIGRGRTHTPPAGIGGAASATAKGGAGTSADAAHPTASGTPSAADGKSTNSTLPNSATTQGANSGGQQNKTAPLNVNTATPQGATSVGRDGRNASSTQTTSTTARPASASTGPRTSTNNSGGNRTTQQGGTNNNTQSSSGVSHSKSGGLPGAPGGPAQAASSVNGQPGGTSAKPTFSPPAVIHSGTAASPSAGTAAPGISSHPTTGAGAARSQGVPVARGTAGSAGTTGSHTPSRAPKGASIPGNTERPSTSTGSPAAARPVIATAPAVANSGASAKPHQESAKPNSEQKSHPGTDKPQAQTPVQPPRPAVSSASTQTISSIREAPQRQPQGVAGSNTRMESHSGERQIQPPTPSRDLQPPGGSRPPKQGDFGKQ